MSERNDISTNIVKELHGALKAMQQSMFLDKYGENKQMVIVGGSICFQAHNLATVDISVFDKETNDFFDVRENVYFND